MGTPMTNYEKQYQESREVCGPPFKEIVTFFKEYPQARLNVLDLGCGQGRDALFIARLGHHVLGVDTSRTGISQMIEQGKTEKLDVSGTVADVVEYEPTEDYDVVILDRILHMLKYDHQRVTVLEKASDATKTDGYILIADTPKNLQLIRKFFEERSCEWTIVTDKKGFIFTRKA